MTKIFLLDAMALIYRAHFALYKYPRTTSKGLETGPILGFTNSLVEVIQKEKPTHIAVVFDSQGPTWRKKLYPNYKAQRQAQPEAISIAIPYIQKILQAFRIHYLSLEGYEADDLIGTLAMQLTKEKNANLYIMSPDKDLAQLVTPNIFLYKPSIAGKPATTWNIEEICSHWNITDPKQIPDILGLWGDASDNIPGIPTIGVKTAQKLIKKHGSIEKIIEHKETLSPLLQKKVTTYASQALLSKKLATIPTDAPISCVLSDMSYQGPDPELLRPLFQELEFRSLAKRILGTQASQTGVQATLFDDPPIQEKLSSFATFATTKTHYTVVDTPEKINLLIQTLHRQTSFALDTETTSLDTQQAKLLGISIAYQPREAYYIPIPYPHTHTSVTRLLAPLRAVMNDEKIEKVGQNLKYDLAILAHYKLTVKGPLFDTMIAHHLLEPDQRHNLTALANKYLAYQPIEIETLTGQKGKNIQMQDVPFDKIVDYACEDADLTWQIYQKIKPLLREAKLDTLFYQVEMKLLPILLRMEQQGIALDLPILQQISTTLAKELAQHETYIHSLADSTFNIASPKQLGEVLFDKLSISEKPVKTPKGQYKTDEITLRKLKKSHPIVDSVLAYRELKKLKSTYADALPKLVSPLDNRIHTSYQQSIVTSGRLSSTNPNLQNIPIRTEKSQKIRQAFIASNPAYQLLSLDYSQIELRIMAHFSEDPTMIQAYLDNKDIHTITAAHVFQIAQEKVTSAMRRKAKIVNFGIIYGISPFGLSQKLDIPRKEAAHIIDAYFQEFSAIKTYMEQSIAHAREQGYVTTLLGRRKYLPDINSRNATVRGFAERNAINMPIQGTAAELIKQAMIDIQQWIDKHHIPAKMLLQVHDELLFEVEKNQLETVAKQLASLMENAMTFKVPLAVNIGTGPNWLAAHS